MYRFDVFELAAAAIVRDNLTTIVDAGISAIGMPTPSAPAQVISVIKLSFDAEHVGRDYLCVIEVLGPDEQVRTTHDIKFNTARAPGSNPDLPVTVILTNALSFVPVVYGIFTVKFYLAGDDTREIKLLIRPVNPT